MLVIGLRARSEVWEVAKAAWGSLTNKILIKAIAKIVATPAQKRQRYLLMQVFVCKKFFIRISPDLVEDAR